jgi:hypothetical protein
MYVVERLDGSLTARIAEIETSDPEHAKALQDDVLFYVRQKHQDLLTQLAVPSRVISRSTSFGRTTSS